MAPDYDIIIMGGALSGSATALQLMRGNPSLRVLIIERSEKLERRVGEATVEISGYFLSRVLNLTEYLNQHHLNKQGLRFWFFNDDAVCLNSCSEIGPKYNVRIPSWQVDRSVLDTHILSLAAATPGVDVWQPAEVKDVTLSPGGIQRISVQRNDTKVELTARWLVDATGMARFLGRKMKSVHANTRHPICSIWTRWTGVKCWDSRELREAFPAFSKRCHGSRNYATNHLVGDGWWSWWIPLKNGDVSIGIVYDARIVQLQEEGSPLDKMMAVLNTHPLTRILLSEAKPCEGDMHMRKNIPWFSDQMAGDGFVLVGDAAGFIDPFYSPGMDWISFTSSAASTLILSERAGEEDVASKAAILNHDLCRSYNRWFEAIYQNKYFYMGDFELMALAFQLDLGTYYYGLVSQPFKNGDGALNTPPFSQPNSTIPYYFIRTYNRRLASIALSRRARNTFGRNNANHSLPFVSFELNRQLPLRLTKLFAKWMLLELREGWRTWFSKPQLKTLA